MDDLVVERLVVALCMVVCEELPGSVAEHILPEEDHSRETLVFDTSDESLDVWIYPHRQLHPIATMGGELFG